MHGSEEARGCYRRVKGEHRGMSSGRGGATEGVQHEELGSGWREWLGEKGWGEYVLMQTLLLYI